MGHPHLPSPDARAPACCPPHPTPPCLQGILLTLSPARTLKEAMTWSAVSVSVVSLDMKSMKAWKVTRPLWLGSTTLMMRLNSASPCKGEWGGGQAAFELGQEGRAWPGGCSPHGTEPEEQGLALGLTPPGALASPCRGPHLLRPGMCPLCSSPPTFLGSGELGNGSNRSTAP